MIDDGELYRIPANMAWDLLQFTTVLYYLHETNPDNMLVRDKTGRYANSAETDVYFDRNKPTYIGGVFESAITRLYKAALKIDPNDKRI